MDNRTETDMSDSGQAVEEYLRTSDVARLLDISPNALRMIEQQFGFPRSFRGDDGHRRFSRDEVLRLRATMRAGCSPIAAVQEILSV